MTSGEQTRVSLVIPTYRERDNIAPLLAAVCPSLESWDYEVIFVDDDSSDGTLDAIRHAIKDNPRIRLIVRQRERGLSGAVIRGFGEATGTVLGSINADLSHDAAVIPGMIRAIESGAELSVGSRRIPGGGFVGWPWHRRLASDMATGLTKIVLKIPLSDPMSGFYFLHRRVFARAQDRLQGLGFKVLLDMTIVARPHPIHEEPYVFKNRQHGKSKLSPKVATQFLHMLWHRRSYARQNAIELSSSKVSAN